eukprot:14432736-Alexandrium_andersonii.AAC.1
MVSLPAPAPRPCGMGRPPASSVIPRRRARVAPLGSSPCGVPRRTPISPVPARVLLGHSRWRVSRSASGPHPTTEAALGVTGGRRPAAPSADCGAARGRPRRLAPPCLLYTSPSPRD